jgi:HPt (histidine-containing phosphotransfer) domain-containing protein
VSDLDPLAALKSRFIARGAEDLATLRGHLDGARLDPTTLRFTVHRLCGAAGTFGYPEISEAAGLAEDDILDRPDQSDASLRRLVETLEHLVQGAKL